MSTVRNLGRPFPIVFLFVAVTLCSQLARAESLEIFDEYPTRFTFVNGVSIAYQDMGERGGVPIVMVIGLGVPLTYWGDPLIRTLVEHGYRVVLLDNRDAGLSERFTRYGVEDLVAAFELLASGELFDPPYVLEDMAGDVVGLMDALSIDSAHVAGASMGGMIAQIIAAKYPDRVRSLISIMSTSGAPELTSADPVSAPPRPPVDAPRDTQIRVGVEMMRVDAGPDSTAFDEEYARLRSARDYDRSHGWSGEGRHFLAVMSSWDRSELLPTIDAPTLVLHGDIDPYFPLAHAQDTARRIENSHLVIIEGMGHSIEPALVPPVATALIQHIDSIEATLAE